MLHIPMTIEESRSHILGELPNGQLTLIVGKGNVGDTLIWAGIRHLLADREVRRISVDETNQHEGDTALVTGSGGWCKAWHSWPRYLRDIEQRFNKVIILPSSFDVRVKNVRRALKTTNATVFARELYSFHKIRNLCDARVAFDCAFFFDFSDYQCEGSGTLHAYRQDRESNNKVSIPDDNRDISASNITLDKWLRTIGEHSIIKTDRAHVMIAGAMLGKTVFYRPSNYHKVPGIAEYSLRGLPVYRDET